MIPALSALRGLAAIAVMLAHTVESFPGGHQWFSAFFGRDTLYGSFLSVLVNAHAAVIVFFTLSGYVLTHRYFETGDATILSRGAIKRLPRLAFLATVSTLFACLLFKLGLMHFPEIVRLYPESGLKRLRFIGNPSFYDAFREGAYRTFLQRTAEYNICLWTMFHEFTGSMAIFGLAPLLRGKLTIWSLYAVCYVAITDTRFILPFIVGMLLARFRPNPGIVGALLGVYLLGYWEPVGDYRYFKLAEMLYVPRITQDFRDLVYATGAGLLVASVAASKFHRFGAYLGRISFPLYVIHLPVVMSLGCWVFLKTGSVPMACFSSWTVAVAMATVLGRWDEWWVRLVNRRLAA